jgi:hypothetical protein
MSSGVGWMHSDASRTNDRKSGARWSVFLAAALVTGLLLLPASASAEFSETDPTTLCKAAVPKCEVGQRYPSGTTIEASLKSGTQFTFLSSFKTSCTGSTVTGKTTAESGTPLSLEVASISASGCTGGCAAGEFQNLPYSASAEQSTGNNATVSVKSSGKGGPRMKFSSCLFGVACTFGASELPLTLEGGNPGTLVAKEASLELQEGSKALCGTSGKINATYEITTPKPVYASRVSETMLCKEFANPCPAASVLPKGTSIEGKLAGELKYSLGILGANSCSGSTMSTATSAEAGNPLSGTMTSLSLSGCTPCSTVEFINLPYATSIEATTNGNGTLKAKRAKLKFAGCTFGIACTFEGDLWLELKGGEFPQLIAKEAALGLIEGSASNCGSVLKLTGTWQSKTKNPVWVARQKA